MIHRSKFLSTLFLLTAFLAVQHQTKAADLVVVPAGPVGTYGTITAAINAAANGDRILVTPQPASTAYVEDLFINKNIQILSNQDAAKFILEGSISITPTANREVSIISMSMQSGRIYSSTTTNYFGNPTVINIFDCEFNGLSSTNYFNIDLLHPDILLTVAGCQLNTGHIQFSAGKIIGNDAQWIVCEGTSDISETVKIIGNKTTYIEIDNPSNEAQVINNYIITTEKTFSNGSSNDYGLALFNIYSSSPTLIQNNSFYVDDYGGEGIRINNTITTGTINIINNIFDSGDSYTEGIRNSSSASIFCNYNYFDLDLYNDYPGITNIGVYSINSANEFVPTTGQPYSGSLAINGADPAVQYYDIDLTVGDAGCYGGSFTHDNFFPLSSGSSKVFFVDAPRGVFQGFNLDVKADGYDK
ncbi:MAG: hypothetical protein MK212_18095 [Saprospiraceae bacterium]|nr:hypothetical protein [Saprospiraceae bacterium]